MELKFQCAYNCFRAMGIRDDPSILNQLVLGLGKKQGLLTEIQPTEQYLYEEIVFHINMAREAEAGSRFISHVLRITKTEGEYSESCTPGDVQGGMIAVGFMIVNNALVSMDIPSTSTPSWCIQFANRRLDEYEPMFRAHYESTEPIPTGNLNIGLASRSHPTTIYLGAVADNYLRALHVSRDDVSNAINVPMFETMLLLRYQILLSSLPLIADR